MTTKNISTAKERNEISRLNQPQVRIRRPTGECSEAHSLGNNVCITLNLALLVGAFWLEGVKNQTRIDLGSVRFDERMEGGGLKGEKKYLYPPGYKGSSLM